MATASTPNPRASLLAGLRTGGVRSASQPHQIPHTAAPGGSFNVPRFASANHPSNHFPEEDEDDQLAEMTSHNLSFNNANNYNGMQGIPMTASAADGGVNKFHQQQQQQMMLRQLAAQRAAVGGGMPYQMHGDQAEMQAQMIQMEMLKYQAFQQAQQAQQYQAELIAQAQRQQQQQQQQQPARSALRRTSMEPLTAGPTSTSFDLRANAAAQLRARAQQAEHRSALSAADDLGPVPMTAAIGGKFATRTLNPNANSFITGRFGDHEDDVSSYASGNTNSGVPPTPGRTTVISGGTSLGTPTTATFSNISAPSKSDAAVSWRRGSSTVNNSVLRSASATPPALNTKVNRTSPSYEEISPSVKTRPQPLRFSVAVSAPLPAVAIDTSNVDEEASSGSSKGGSPTSTSTPSTPPSAHSSISSESKKPYEGLGMGRPAMNGATMRHASLPSRQPKGPPSGADELGPRNFATRLRRKAIGGLGALVTAREMRDMAVEIQAY